jgi:hypothetical protein
MEQQAALMAFRHTTFRESELAVGLPWTAVPGSAPLTMSAIDSGIDPFAASPHARDVFLHRIMRKVCTNWE